MSIRQYLIFILLLLATLSLLSHEKGKIVLTEAEKEWLKEHPVIRVANENDWAPFDFVDYDKPKGLVIDHIKMIAEIAGFEIEYVNGYSWSELQDLFKEKKIDVMPVYYKNSDREKFTLYTKPYHKAKLAIFVRSDNSSNVLDLTKLNVSMQKTHGSINIVRQQVPGVTINEVEHTQDLVLSLAKGETDVIIGNPLVFYHNARELQIENIKLADYIDMNEHEQLDTSFYVGIREDWPVLHSIVQKAMDNMCEDEFSNIVKKWTGFNVIRIDWDLIIRVLAVVALILLFLFYNNNKLKKMVSLKTVELNNLNEELEEKVRHRTDELLKLNKKLKKSSQTDYLTNIHNRRYFFSIADHYFKLAKRRGSSFSCAMIDVDRFKNINDMHGHETGDKILKLVTQSVAQIIRNSDIFARIGGEEFILLLPDTDSDGALKISEKIKDLIYESTMDTQIPVTVSIGVSEYQSEDSKINDIMSRADSALYKAKNNGRNRVEK